MDKITSSLARSDDGTVQINFSVPASLIQKTKDEVTLELAGDIEIPGFRKGKAPIEKAKSKIPENTLLEKTLSKILPKAFGDAITKYKLKPAIYPKFELIKAPARNATHSVAGGKDGEDWEIRATTCELPEIELGDYKKAIRAALATKSIYVPGKEPARNASLARNAVSTASGHSDAGGEKDQAVIKTLLASVKINIPKVLIEEEVNGRLSNLLARIEKLGLSLETYLSSLGKTADTLRAEYEKQARDGIALELILNKIAQSENIKVEEKQIDEAIKVSSLNDTPEQRRVVRGALERRAVIDSLAGLV